ncbi:MAG TPA: hypothetical protein VJT50_13200 [Pyrinomonadaceae bacterium]|nr:hypothetical protein [Pyrinomonadaceae bacterium]
MKPISSKSEDENCLEDIGRASLQIVHDLKNQLNGLKLYATFLRKRLEKSKGSGDELETIIKLIAGIDRAAEDLSLLTDYSQPPTPRKQFAVELQKTLNAAVANINADAANTTAIVMEAGSRELMAELDAGMITEAFKSITQGAARILKNRKQDGPLKIQLTEQRNENGGDAVIDWHIPDAFDHDPFRSFAGSSEIRMALAAKMIEAHGGAAEKRDGTLRVRLPLTNQG